MWYSISVLLKNNNTNLWEETIILVQAKDETEARRKGEYFGKKMESEYNTISGQNAKWIFERVLAIYAIAQESIGDGTEIFSRHLRKNEVKSLLIPFKG